MTSCASKLPFAHLNLRFNPFGELSKEERAKIAVVELGFLPSILQKPKQAVQFVADHGRGKSTHLIALHQHFQSAPYTQIHIGDKPQFEKHPLHFVDSIEILKPYKRKRLYKLAHSIAITCHCNLEHELKNAGYSVYTVKVSLNCKTTLLETLNKRIEFARRSSGAIPLLTATNVDSLQKKFGNNIRAMESHLYFVFQSLEGVIDVEV